MSPGLPEGVGAKVELEMMDHVHLFICPTLFTHVPRTGTGHHSSPPVPSCWSSLQAAWDEMNQLLPLSQVNPHKAQQRQGLGFWIRAHTEGLLG